MRTNYNHQITATVIADSINSNGNRITTFELTMPRFIWAEMLTHRLFSRNAASSRAIPVSKTSAAIKSNPATPSLWGANEAGMQSNSELIGFKLSSAKFIWKLAATTAANFSLLLSKIGLHKQYANRISEYAQIYKVVLTATEFDNFFHLRCHKDAQPEIQVLANVMHKAMQQSYPNVLKSGEWHLPYIKTLYVGNSWSYYDTDDQLLTLDEAKRISASCCAQVSYRLLDESLDKANVIYDRLVNATPIHASPFEHQATPMVNPIQNIYEGKVNIEDGITHIDINANAWSGNFKGWIQHRHLIDGNTCYKYDDNT